MVKQLNKTPITKEDIEAIKKHLEDKNKLSKLGLDSKKVFYTSVSESLEEIASNTRNSLEKSASGIMWGKIVDRLQVIEDSIKSYFSDKQSKEEVTHELGVKFVVYKGKVCKRQSLEPIPDNEPVFIIRGRDKFTIRLLGVFQLFCEEDNCTQWQNDCNNATLKAFRDFKKNHPELIKQPGITLGK